MDSELQYIEKRADERLSVKIKAEVKEIEPDEVLQILKEHPYKDLSKADLSKTRPQQDMATLFTQNISVGGLMLVSDTPLKEGRPLALYLHLPDIPVPIGALALVVWCDEKKDAGGRYKAGLRFTGISQDDLGRMHQYILLQKRAEMEKRRTQ